jgi:hypothetical protein
MHHWQHKLPVAPGFPGAPVGPWRPMGKEGKSLVMVSGLLSCTFQSPALQRGCSVVDPPLHMHLAGSLVGPGRVHVLSEGWSSTKNMSRGHGRKALEQGKLV